MNLKRQAEPTRRAKRPIHMMGWRENVGPPVLGVPIIKAKIDTGARTSALCAKNIRIVEGDQARVRSTYPNPMMAANTWLRALPHWWEAEISLTDRTDMGFDLILGRTALRGHKFWVNPAQSFLIGDSV